MRGRMVLATVAGLLATAGGVAAAEAAAAAPPMWQWGWDIRVRQEVFDHIPLNADPPGETRGGLNNYLRIRPRLWGQVNPTDTLSLRARVTDEFREYARPDEEGFGKNTYNPQDEVVVDQLYLDWKKLLDDTLDLRIGRQDLIYGNGRVLMDGTPKDGSRTIYFDAVKATYRGVPKTTVDLLGICDLPENELVLWSQDRDLTGLAKGYNDMAEYGAGVYVKNKALEELNFEAYYLYKQEEEWTQAAKKTETGYAAPARAWQELDSAAGEIVNPQLDLHTAGFRLMPKLGQMGASIEAAYQLGERGSEDTEGWMVDAVLNWNVPMDALKPVVGIGWYGLSGDDPKTPEDEGWNPLFARWPQYSELYVYAWDADGAGRWSNLSMPHVDLSLTPCKWYKSEMVLGYMMAMEDDGPGDGKDRGLLFTWWQKFTLRENLLREKDKLSGHLLAELVDPGDYYNVDDLSYFLRWEFIYAF